MTGGTKDFCAIYQEVIVGLNVWIHTADHFNRNYLPCRFSAPGCFDPASTNHPKLATAATQKSDVAPSQLCAEHYRYYNIISTFFSLIKLFWAD